MGGSIVGSDFMGAKPKVVATHTHPELGGFAQFLLPGTIGLVSNFHGSGK